MIKIGNSLTEPITNKDSTENYWFTPMYFSRLFGLRDDSSGGADGWCIPETTN